MRVVLIFFIHGHVHVDNVHVENTVMYTDLTLSVTLSIALLKHLFNELSYYTRMSGLFLERRNVS